MQPEIINHHLYSSFSNDLDKIQKVLRNHCHKLGVEEFCFNTVFPHGELLFFIYYMAR